MVDSSSSSAGSSFRELDDVFLQTQTRIWLGEVLGKRLDEDLPISDLLQDGEILFEVSKVLWNFLLTKKELRHLKQKFRPFGSKKISGRYRPYSNIDSFLKICKILGLSGIDLFSPSDVVEKKNTRKVCICIRALSKKARSKLLTVPDFNVVRYSVPMSTGMVGILRRSLESPQCTVSSSSSNTPQKGSVTKSKQKKLYKKINGDDDSSSDESDEAESRYMGGNGLSPASKLNCGSDQENSPEAQSLSQYNHRNSTGNSNFNHPLEKDYSIVGDSSPTSVGENNYISEYLKFSDLMVHANNGDSPVILDGEKNMFDFFLNIDSQESGRSSQNKLYDDEDIEVSSTTSMSSVLGRLLNLEFDDQFDEDELSSANIYSYESKECEVASESFGPQTSNPENNFCPQNKDVNQETLLGEEKGNTAVIHVMESNASDVSSNKLAFSRHGETDKSERSCEHLHNVNIGKGLSSQQASLVVQDDTCETLSDNHSCLPVKDMNKAQEDGLALNSAQDNNVSATENEIQDVRENQLHIPDENNLDGKKRRKRPVLETFVKGTAIAGVLFLLLQIRRLKGNEAQETQPRAQVSKKNGMKPSSTKSHTRSVGKGMYPSDRIRL